MKHVDALDARLWPGRVNTMRSDTENPVENKKSLSTSLLVLEVSSIALGYAALAVLAAHADVRILDASPSGLGRFIILAQGELEILRDQLQKTRGKIDGTDAELVIDHELIEGADPEVLKALFSLAQNELEESLLVIETDTVAGLLSVSQILTQIHGLKPIDIKIQRGGNGGGYGFFTSSTAKVAPAAEDARTHLKSAMRKGHVETIENPVAGFRRFFNLSGKA
jgi:hypothetical protein